jgi:hypothetical protein
MRRKAVAYVGTAPMSSSRSSSRSGWPKRLAPASSPAVVTVKSGELTPDHANAALVAQRAELDPVRIVEAISSRKEELRSKKSRTTTHDEGRGTR